MKVITKKYKVYDFKELTKEVKEDVINKWYEHEHYPFMENDLTESLKALLAQHKIHIRHDFKLHYSLSCSQGDGACFVGSFKWKKYYVDIIHNSHYYHERSTDISLLTKYGNEVKYQSQDKFKKLYYSICRKIEKEGYRVIEYRMSFDEFQEHCEANEYNFLKDGKMVNY